MNVIKKSIGIAILFTQWSCSSHQTDTLSEASDSLGQLIEVSSVALDMTDAEGLLKIKASAEPKYNVFKLTDPDRLVVDILDAKKNDDVLEELEGNRFVSLVKVQNVSDALSSSVRIEVQLQGAVNYFANVDGGDLSLRMISSTESPIASSDAPVTPEVVAEVPLVEPTPMPEPVVETPPQPEMVTAAPAPATIQTPEVAPTPDQPGTSEELLPLPVEAETPKVEVAPLPIVKSEEKPVEKSEAPAAQDAPPTLAELIPKQIESQEIPSSGQSGSSVLADVNSKNYEGKRVSLEFQDANIQDILRLLADVSKLNIIVSEEVKGKITLKLVDVPWDQALDIILTSKGLDKVQHGNIIRVAPAESLKKEREIALANDRAAKQLEPLKLKLLNVSFAKADEISTRLKNMLSERGTVDIDPRTNTIIVRDIQENISRIENLVKVLDTQTPQVRIESRIVQANDNFSHNIGVQWGPSLKLDHGNNRQRGWMFPRVINLNTESENSSGDTAGFSGPTGSALTNYTVDALPGSSTGSALGFRLGSINDIFNLDVRLSYAQTQNLARIVSRPSVTVLDNKTARIIQGSKIPFLSSSSEGSNVQFQEAGIEIEVTPQVTNEGSVLLKVSTKSNEPTSEAVGGNPIVSIREATTEMLVKSGRTAVLGGVYKTNKTESEVGVPGLMNIPILGWLFKGRSRGDTREELLIFITPYVLSDAREAVKGPSSSSSLEP